jgi:hypothetical protein
MEVQRVFASPIKNARMAQKYTGWAGVDIRPPPTLQLEKCIEKNALFFKLVTTITIGERKSWQNP